MVFLLYVTTILYKVSHTKEVIIELQTRHLERNTKRAPHQLLFRTVPFTQSRITSEVLYSMSRPDIQIVLTRQEQIENSNKRLAPA